MKLSIISPIYNEEKVIEELVERLVSSLKGNRYLSGDADWEILLIDDVSTDNSLAVIRHMMDRYPTLIKGVRHKENQGQGGAQRTGFYLAKGEYCVTIDSDMEKYPEDIPLVLDKLIAQEHHVVCTYILEKNMFSIFGNMFLRCLLHSPVRQASTSLMGLKTAYVKNINLVKNDQRYVLPIAVSQGARKIGEVLARYDPRRHGRSNYSMFRKVFQGIPEMLSTQRRIRRGFYNNKLDHRYNETFELL